jgi:hypothetical protein
MKEAVSKMIMVCLGEKVDVTLRGEIIHDIRFRKRQWEDAAERSGRRDAEEEGSMQEPREDNSSTYETFTLNRMRSNAYQYEHERRTGDLNTY